MYIRILLALAILPGFFLILRVYHLDTVEKEPTGLLIKLFILGALSTIYAFLLESLGSAYILPSFEDGSLSQALVEYFLVIALVEESGKYIMLRQGSWNNPAFNFQFDGVVYAVCVGMGFAIIENIEYVFSYGITTALVRAVTSIPGHCVFAIFMGHYYGKAKLYANMGDAGRSSAYRFMSLFIPTLIHGIYDFTCSSESEIMFLIYIVFIVVLYVFAFLRLKVYSREDAPV